MLYNISRNKYGIK